MGGKWLTISKENWHPVYGNDIMRDKALLASLIQSKDIYFQFNYFICEYDGQQIKAKIESC